MSFGPKEKAGEPQALNNLNNSLYFAEIWYCWMFCNRFVILLCLLLVVVKNFILSKHPGCDIHSKTTFLMKQMRNHYFQKKKNILICSLLEVYAAVYRMWCTGTSRVHKQNRIIVSNRPRIANVRLALSIFNKVFST
jgi:hypothetical protein